MSLHKFRWIGSDNIALKVISDWPLMNIHEHGVPHLANEIVRNIWQFGNDIALRIKFGRHFLVA